MDNELNLAYHQSNQSAKPIITLDTDWAPDYILKDTISILKQYRVKATLFVTNPSDIIEELKTDRSFELGIHPNFHPGSTQGNDMKSIMYYLLDIIPNAVSVRTHTLLTSSRMMQVMKDYGIKYDSSIYLHKMSSIDPTMIPDWDLVRLPIFWADDVGINDVPNDFELQSKGLKIFNFHPIHIYLNSKDIQACQSIKNDMMNKSKVDRVINKNEFGVRDYFIKVLSDLNETLHIKEVGMNWLETRS